MSSYMSRYSMHAGGRFWTCCAFKLPGTAALPMWRRGLHRETGEPSHPVHGAREMEIIRQLRGAAGQRLQRKLLEALRVLLSLELPSPPSGAGAGATGGGAPR